jgi:hypothetical protein
MWEVAHLADVSAVARRSRASADVILEADLFCKAGDVLGCASASARRRGSVGAGPGEKVELGSGVSLGPDSGRGRAKAAAADREEVVDDERPGEDGVEVDDVIDEFRQSWRQ